jgi:hypothetical protein
MGGKPLPQDNGKGSDQNLCRYAGNTYKNEESIWTLKEMEAAGDESKLTEQGLIKSFQPANVKVLIDPEDAEKICARKIQASGGFLERTSHLEPRGA